MFTWLKVWWLKGYLGNPDPPHIERAVKALVATGHPSVPELLRPLLRHSMSQVNQIAIKGLVATGHPSVPDMLHPLLDCGPWFAKEAANALLDFGWKPPTEEEHLALLITAGRLEQAVEAHGEKAADLLIEVFKKEPKQSQVVVGALARLGEPALQKLPSHIRSLLWDIATRQSNTVRIDDKYVDLNSTENKNAATP